MHQTFTRLSLAAALLIAGGLPVLAQGSANGTATVPGPRPAVSAPAATPTAQAIRPATPTPAATTQAVRPATPAQPGGSVQQQGAAAGHATGTQQAATPARPAAPRSN